MGHLSMDFLEKGPQGSFFFLGKEGSLQVGFLFFFLFKLKRDFVLLLSKPFAFSDLISGTQTIWENKRAIKAAVPQRHGRNHEKKKGLLAVQLGGPCGAWAACWVL